jgi:hypothetical protein
MKRAAQHLELWGIQNHFQIVMRLQLVRRLVRDVVNGECSWDLRWHEMEDILIAMQGVAAAARTAGLSGFTSICLHLCERVLPPMRSGYLPIALLADWAANAELYLRRPHRREFATALLEQLNDPQWLGPLDPAEQASLLRALLEPSGK